MSVAIIVNSIGLIFDIVGALLIFFFGIPPNIDRAGSTFIIIEGSNKDEMKKAKKYDFRSHSGLGLLIIGFILQLVSNFLK